MMLLLRGAGRDHENIVHFEWGARDTMKIGIQASSLKKYLQTPRDVTETFRRLKAMGYSYVQIEWVGDEVSDENVRESLDESGLLCTGTQDGFDNISSRLDEIIWRNSLWKGKYVCGAVSIPAEEGGALALAARLNAASKRLNECGMVLEIHPMFQSFLAVDGVSPLDRLWEHLDGAVLLQPDFYHVVRGKADPAGLVEKYRGRIAEAHFKDFRVLDGSLDMAELHDFDPLKQGAFPVTPIGQGIVPWKEIIEACGKCGVEYAFVEQEAWDKDPFECMKESFEYLLACGLGA